MACVIIPVANRNLQSQLCYALTFICHSPSALNLVKRILKNSIDAFLKTQYKKNERSVRSFIITFITMPHVRMLTLLLLLWFY